MSFLYLAYCNEGVVDGGEGEVDIALSKRGVELVEFRQSV